MMRVLALILDRESTGFARDSRETEAGAK